MGKDVKTSAPVEYCVYNLTRRSFLALRVTTAATMPSRLRGLLGRPRLASDEGLWVVPSCGIHTLGLFYPIDVVYLSADYTVVHTVEHLSPFSVASFKGNAQSVLELPIRTIYCSGTAAGDRLLICTPEEFEERSAQVRSPGLWGVVSV